MMRRAGRWAAGLFWIIQFVELTLVSLTEGQAFAEKLLLPRAIVMFGGLILTLPIIEIAARTGHRSFRFRLFATLAAALAMCTVLLVVNFATFYWLVPHPGNGFDLNELVYTGFGWSWFFVGIAGSLVGLSYSLEVRDRERRLVAMELVARDTRLAALRYQLNPHFLFNTLNSIAALIHGGDQRDAEEMVEALADFLRVTLEIDPVADITLSEEVDLQSLYLAIEQIRFPERLRTRVELSPGTERALVPALLLQPLIENAIIHGVARTTKPVEVVIKARIDGDHLNLSVENDSFGTQRPSVRSGVGLANVRGRLESRYNSRHVIVAGRDGARFRVDIQLPLELKA